MLHQRGTLDSQRDERFPGLWELRVGNDAVEVVFAESNDNFLGFGELGEEIHGKRPNTKGQKRSETWSTLQSNLQLFIARNPEYLDSIIHIVE